MTEEGSNTASGQFSTIRSEIRDEEVSNVQYKLPQDRAIEAVAVGGTIIRPNYEDILRRVSVVVQQHVEKCEIRLAAATPETQETGKFF